MEDLLALDVLEPAHELEHLRCGGSRLVARYVAREHDELVTAKTRDEVLRAHGVTELLRRELEQVVAGGVTAGIVDVLELIEVDEEQGAASALVGTARELRVQLFDEAMAIREARELVVVREM